MGHQNSVFIDPKTCGSSVGYYITVDDYEDRATNKTNYTTRAAVVLADCSHKIDWSFEDGDLDKIDSAINMLMEFRKKYIETTKIVEKLNR